VITNIGYDHMQFLGDTLAKIAKEKAGIIKPGVPVVIGETHPETLTVFKRRAHELHSKIFFADTSFYIKNHDHTSHKAPFLRLDVIKNGDTASYRYLSPLASIYQLKNIVTVLKSIDILKGSGFVITEENIYNGIKHVVKNTHLQGRWQIIGYSPLTIADIGHNKDGITEVIRQIENTPHRSLHFVIGVVNDKDVDAMLSLLPKNALYYFCKADIPRGLDPKILAQNANAKGLSGITYNSVREALEAARKNAHSDDLVVVSGSAFVVAEVI
jgi:dihydrofolate synthase / folylpolyglutamate synthase